MRYFSVCALLLTLPTITIAAQSSPAQAAASATQPAAATAEPAQYGLHAHELSVADVLALEQAKVGESVILAKLTQANRPVDLTTAELLQLKQAGVSDAVVRAMIAPGGAGPAAGQAAQGGALVIENATADRLHGLNPTGATTAYGVNAAATIDNPLAPHDSGVYLATAVAGGGEHLHFIDRATIAGVSEKNIGLALFTFTAVPLVFKYQVQPGKAPTRTSDTLPIFYFYFEDKAAALGKSAFSAANVSAASQFKLVRMSANKKQREIFVESAGIGTGVHTTNSDAVAFTSDRLSSGLYRVTMKAPLKPGEYAFVGPSAPGAFNDASAVKPDIFDFGVDTK